MSLLDGFKTKEDLLRYVSENVSEKDGLCFIDEVLAIQEESNHRKAILDREIGQKKVAIKRAQQAEVKIKELEEDTAGQTPPSGNPALVRELRSKINELTEQLGEFESMKTEVRSNRIFDVVRRAAIVARVPKDVYDSDVFHDHVLARFTIDDATGEVIMKGDAPLSVEEFISAKQKSNPLWYPQGKEGDSSSGRENRSSGKSLSVGDMFVANKMRADEFDKAAEKNDVRGMIRNAPMVNPPIAHR